MPPGHPSILGAFLKGVAHGLSLSECRLLGTGGHGSKRVPLVFSRVRRYVPSLSDARGVIRRVTLASVLGHFLSSLSLRRQGVFVEEC